MKIVASNPDAGPHIDHLSHMTKSSRAIRSIMNWMRQSAERGQPVSVDQVKAWAETIGCAIDTLDARETEASQTKALIEDQLEAIKDRLDLPYVVRLADSFRATLPRLCALAMDAATKDELKEIDVMACAMLDAFDAICLGVGRPAETPIPYIPPYQ